MRDSEVDAVSRRRLLTMIGTVAGATAMYNAMTELGLAEESGYAGPPKLGKAKPGASVLILGAWRGWWWRSSCGTPDIKCSCWNTITAPAEGTGRSMAATPIPSWAERPSMSSSIPGFISIPAPGGFLITITASCIIAAG